MDEQLTNSILSSLTDLLYFFGTEVISDWKVGSPIVYKGVYEGKAYEDKGTILKLEPEKLLETTHWSNLAGVADVPENYHKVTYELSTKNNQTTLSIAQDNNASEEERDHSEKNWSMVLKNLKELLEK